MNSFHFLGEANRKSEWIWKMYAIFAVFTLLNIIVSSIASIVFCWMKYGVFDTNQLYTTFTFSLPWDQTTKLGYFMEMICDLIFGEFYLLGNGAFLLLFISICLYHLAFYKRFKYSISKLSQSENPGNDKKLLCDLIQFHNMVKEWVKSIFSDPFLHFLVEFEFHLISFSTDIPSWFVETANVYSSLILVQLVISMLTLAQLVFQLDLVTKIYPTKIFPTVNFENIFTRIAANAAHWFQCRDSCEWCIGHSFEFVYLLFRWEIGHGKFWKHG